MQPLSGQACEGLLRSGSARAAAGSRSSTTRLSMAGGLVSPALIRVCVQFGERLEQLDLFLLGAFQLECHALILGGFSCLVQGPDRAPHTSEFTLQAVASNLPVHARGHRRRLHTPPDNLTWVRWLRVPSGYKGCLLCV